MLRAHNQHVDSLQVDEHTITGGLPVFRDSPTELQQVLFDSRIDGPDEHEHRSAACLVRARRIAAQRHLAASIVIARGGVQGRRLVQLLLLLRLRLHADVLVRLLVHLLVGGVVHPAAHIQARAAHLRVAGAATREQMAGGTAARSAFAAVTLNTSGNRLLETVGNRTRL